MDLIRHFAHLPEKDRGAVVALGNFDGLHAGHKKVLLQTAEMAHELKAPVGVVSFEPHPRSLFQKEAAPFRLTPLDVKLKLLAEEGVEKSYIVEFDEEFREKTADEFLNDFLGAQLGVRGVVVGHDFCFGANRQGTVEMLQKWGDEKGIAVRVITECTHEDGTSFSSTQLRDFIRAGNVRAAADFLHRPWEIDGIVIQGDQRGRTIGFPTANIDLADYLRPAFGVYAVRVLIQGQETLGWLPAVANIGRRPTFNKENDLLEVHLFDFDQDIYGQKLQVQLIDFLRPEQKFSGIEALVTQIRADSEKAQKILAENKH